MSTVLNGVVNNILTKKDIINCLINGTLNQSSPLSLCTVYDVKEIMDLCDKYVILNTMFDIDDTPKNILVEVDDDRDYMSINILGISYVDPVLRHSSGERYFNILAIESPANLFSNENSYIGATISIYDNSLEISLNDISRNTRKTYKLRSVIYSN